MLVTIIEEKEKMIRNYAKELEEASLALATKEEKYSKLKLYYQDVVDEENKLIASFMSESRAERDFDSFGPLSTFKPF